jgi:ribose transport system substrate-binding protein
MLRRCLLPILCLAALVGCHREPKRIVGVVPKGASHVFWQTVHAGAVKAAREFGLEVEWNAPALEIDSSRQIEILDSMINRGVAGIAVAPVDKQALVGVVERAARSGIPVAIYDSAIDTSQRIAYIATDNKEGGRMAARQLCAIVGGKGKVAVLGFMAGSASTMEREDGFMEEMRAACPGVQMLPLQFAAGQAKAMALTENMLTANPDLAGLFADNESSSAGAVQALKSRGKPGAVKLVGFDASDQLIEDLKSGYIDSLVVQDPFRMGYESTRAIGLKLRGETPPQRTDLKPALIRAQDLSRSDVTALLYPDIQQYLK